MRSIASIVVAALVAMATTVASTGAFAGAYLESANSEPGSKAPAELNKLWFDGGKMRSENGARGGGTWPSSGQGMYIIDPRTKSYRIINKATIDQMAAKLGEARKKMESEHGRMPPERRAMNGKDDGPGGRRRRRECAQAGAQEHGPHGDRRRHQVLGLGGECRRPEGRRSSARLRPARSWRR